MDPIKRKDVLTHAEQGAWERVVDLIEHDATLAKAQDDFGMLPLHWACTEPTIALNDFETILCAFPDACTVETVSGMLPLHVAITSKMHGLHINALLHENPDAAFAKDGRGLYPIELAMEHNLPKFTIDLIRKAGAKAVRSSSSSLSRSVSLQLPPPEPVPELIKAESMGSSMATRRASEYARLLDEKIASPSTSSCSSASLSAMDSATIAVQLKELLAQLQQLSVDIRSSSCSSTSLTSSSSSTYRSSSSFSSASSSTLHAPTNSFVQQVLWNPCDKLGITFEPIEKDKGAKIKKLGKSNALGVEVLSSGDVLISINGTNVTGASHASILRFLKHAKITCKLCFTKGSSVLDYSQASFDSMGNQVLDQEGILYSKIAEMLDTTVRKVSAVEETVRLSTAMSFCS